MAYAVELGVHVSEEHAFDRQMHGISIKDDLLVQQTYDIRTTNYKMDNRTAKEKVILVERNVMHQFIPFDTPEPQEKTLDTYRYKVVAPAGKITEFKVKERCLRAVHQQLRDLSLQTLQHYFENKFLNKKLYESLKEVLDILAEIARLQKVIKEEQKKCSAVYTAQTQIQKNMAALSMDGEEGKLRGRYVKQLSDKEEQLAKSETIINETETKIREAEARFRELLSKLT